ncbi:NgoMIV family type II restriction endonuclease [Streptomyces sp. CNQ085]|uniref:NgoMIV family type II restriction endonuclease n=1 Tax=Streptomyces sp. CNQ085 TaxID=2886944 RepID=UPI001F5064B1|nr:NgoMIV family type II restriction endonuclease [Streptomyces sp. CNQ085]MCI0385935.1 hypothetical protein [Streptomyces sp. CNQ085]
MTTAFASHLYGWRKPRGKSHLVPNCADSANIQSVDIATAMMAHMGIAQTENPAIPADPGPLMEKKVRDDLVHVLPSLDSTRHWLIQCGKVVTEFSQYGHLRRVDELVRKNPELRVTIGRDYLIKPDVTIGLTDLEILGDLPFLHGAIACKWTIRSDRVQNIRHECNQMIRHRRGRQPHLVTVTAEPLPSRLAAIARGTGEVDAVYHIAYDALDHAVQTAANKEQQAAWHEAVQQQRLLPYGKLAETLVKW